MNKDYKIISNQCFPDSKALRVDKNKGSYAKPISNRSKKAWQEVVGIYKKSPRPIVLDSGCGRGMSSVALAKKYPNCWVFAIDKSEFRLASNYN